jgi:hypothetical protein
MLYQDKSGNPVSNNHCDKLKEAELIKNKRITKALEEDPVQG